MADIAALRNREDATGRLVCALETIDPHQLGAVVKSYAEKLLGQAAWPRQELDAQPSGQAAAAGRVSPELIQRARDLLLARIAEG